MENIMTEKAYIDQALKDVSAARQAILKVGELNKIKFDAPPDMLEEIRQVMNDAMQQMYDATGISVITLNKPIEIQLMSDAISQMNVDPTGKTTTEIKEILTNARQKLRNVRYRLETQKGKPRGF